MSEELDTVNQNHIIKLENNLSILATKVLVLSQQYEKLKNAKTASDLWLELHANIEEVQKQFDICQDKLNALIEVAQKMESTPVQTPGQEENDKDKQNDTKR